VGLEIKREIYGGELSRIKNALLPIVAALGGMVVPGLIHLSFNAGTVTQSGFGIPMATDIAFSLGALSLLGNRVPLSLKVVLAALAIIDDLGAILVIAFFYVHEFSGFHFGIAIMIFAGLMILNRLRVNNLFIYIIPGVVMWFFMLKSGVHATIAGVLLACAIPLRKGEESSLSYRVQHFLDRPVPLVILPLFALANTSIMFSPGWYFTFIDRNTAGILAGLILGKPLGIVIFSAIAVKIGMCRLPDDLSWRHMIGTGILGGIGLTMSIFITNLAFLDGRLIQNSKIAILSASAVAGMAGFLSLFRAKRSSAPNGR
jgi:NhaA family Na+:H+ antiporter